MLVKTAKITLVVVVGAVLLFVASGRRLSDLRGYLRASADATVDELTDQLPPEVQNRKLAYELQRLHQDLIDREVSLKKLAAAVGAKDAAMLPPAEAERITGYHVGGISPFGQKKRARVFVESAALANATIIVNGGRRGLQIELKPDDLVRVLDATSVELCA